MRSTAPDPLRVFADSGRLSAISEWNRDTGSSFHDLQRFVSGGILIYVIIRIDSSGNPSPESIDQTESGYDSR